MKIIPIQLSAIFEKRFLSVVILVANLFSWYFPLYIFIQRAIGEFQMGSTPFLLSFGIQFSTAIVFAILGNIMVKKFSNRDTFLTLWIASGIVASILTMTFNTFDMTSISIVSFLVGFSLGFGFPACLAYFGDNTTVENRGFYAGIIFFVASLCTLFIGIIVTNFSIQISALTLALWRGLGLLFFLLIRTKNDLSQEKPVEVSYRTVLFDRSFLLYLIPWTMFAMVNFLETPIVHGVFGDELSQYISLAEFGLGAFVALIAGRFADSVGRKRVIMVGFTMLGIGYAALTAFQDTPLFQYLYIILDGVAWGIFLPMFFLVVWSDLAAYRIKEKFYVIGLVPFLIASYSLIIIRPFAGDINDASLAFTLASFFIFIALLPLSSAPETMPEKNIELKRLKKFANDAKKMKEKFENKE